uniref:Secreted protein n=1 Tax=Panagrellus redivivus TaxID=6233 RepID=A0A7E4V0D4_PANRE
MKTLIVFIAACLAVVAAFPPFSPPPQPEGSSDGSFVARDGSTPFFIPTKPPPSFAPGFFHPGHTRAPPSEAPIEDSFKHHSRAPPSEASIVEGSGDEPESSSVFPALNSFHPHHHSHPPPSESPIDEHHSRAPPSEAPIFGHHSRAPPSEAPFGFRHHSRAPPSEAPSDDGEETDAPIGDGVGVSDGVEAVSLFPPGHSFHPHHPHHHRSTPPSNNGGDTTHHYETRGTWFPWHHHTAPPASDSPKGRSEEPGPDGPITLPPLPTPF